MKNVSWWRVGVLTAVLSAAGAPARAKPAETAPPSAQPPAAAAEAPAVWLYAEGLSCPLCAHNLEAQLKRVPGVARVTIDLSLGRAGVWFAAGREPTSAQLRKAVEDSGFTFIREERP